MAELEKKNKHQTQNKTQCACLTGKRDIIRKWKLSTLQFNVCSPQKVKKSIISNNIGGFHIYQKTED